ncbi:MAG: hypothetical protein JWL76_1490 [Thermoleophilia bacterium]|nr:hypothetical protein [Thermoleophilia bacterium]
MTDAWTEKQLAQFVRVRDGFIKTGFPEDVAAEHAARTIEQSRKRPKKAEPDPANPTKDDLYREAMRYNITGRSKMDKDQLANAVHGHRRMDRHQ